MEEIINKLFSLSVRSSQITLYKGHIVSIMKGTGRIIGKFDKELLDFLKATNGASVFDYCFMGFKNSQLGVNLDKYQLDFWPSNNRLAGRFLTFASTSTGDNFGYLIDVMDDKGCHPIAYYSEAVDDSICVIGSSFKEFMRTFLADVEDELNRSGDKFIVNIEKDGWPFDVGHWMAHDSALRENQAKIHDAIRKYMPDTRIF